jgi:hypothetical protein
MPFEINHCVTLLHKQRGGYGFIDPVAAVVCRVTPKRVRIRVAQKVNGNWTPKYVSMKREQLRERTKPVAALGETEWARHGHDYGPLNCLRTIALAGGGMHHDDEALARACSRRAAATALGEA